MPDPAAQGAEERWTMYVCRKCGRATTREGERCGGWSRHNGNRYNRVAVEVVPLSRAQEAEAERDQWKRAANGDRDGVVTHEYHLRMLKAVVAEREALRTRLEAVEGALREANAHIGLEPDGPTEAEIRRTILAALNPEQGGEK